MLRSVVAFVVVMALSASLVFAAEAAPAPAPPAQTPALNAADLIARAQTALDGLNTLKAQLRVDIWYPAQYYNVVTLQAAKNGDERAEITTTMRDDTFKSIEVVSGGVVWSESDSPEGPMVTKIDVNKLKAALEKDKKAFAALPMLGTTGLFDLANLARVESFTEAHEGTIGTRKVYVVSGTLKDEYKTGDKALPAAVERFYSTVVLYLGADDLFPWQVDLGSEDGHPLARVAFTEVERNAAIPEGTFTYTPPEGTTVIDRTAWAQAELERGK